MTSIEEQSLLSAIWDCPEDDYPRLAYSDWLQEQGEDDRASYIREHVIGKYRDQETWLGPSDSLMHKSTTVARGDRRLKGGGAYPDGKLWWRRGFCYRADVHSESLQWVPYLCHTHPVEEVRLTDKRPGTYWRGLGYWEPENYYISRRTVPTSIIEVSDWNRCILTNGSRVYLFASPDLATRELRKTVAKWGRNVVKANREGFEKL